MRVVMAARRREVGWSQGNPDAFSWPVGEVTGLGDFLLLIRSLNTVLKPW